MKSWLIHYKNKFLNAVIHMTDLAFDVLDQHGNHAVAIRKNANGQWVCQSKELGCSDVHDLAPIPRDARVFKEVDGKVVLDEMAEHRKKARKKFLCPDGIKVLSMEELKGKGFEFDAKGNVTKEPTPVVIAPPATSPAASSETPVVPAVGSPAPHELTSEN